jgi:hypothetical protein
MAKSLFQKNNPEGHRPTPHELIESEIVHLKKGSSVRYGPKAKPVAMPHWLLILAICGLTWLYLVDPFLHAWYKGEAIRDYLYLHNYAAGPLTDQLVATQIFSPGEVDTLNHRHGSFQDYYASPEAANREAHTIIDYMTALHLLHAGKYQQLDPVGKMRYFLFLRTGIGLPTQWSFLDPAVSD